MRDSRIAHESLRRYSGVVPPRVGGGVGVREGDWAEGPMHRQGSSADRIVKAARRAGYTDACAFGGEF